MLTGRRRRSSRRLPRGAREALGETAFFLSVCVASGVFGALLVGLLALVAT